MLEKSSIARRQSAFALAAKPQSSAAPVSIRPLQAEARWSLRLPERDVTGRATFAGFQLDQPINRFTATDGRTAIRLGPDEWLLLAPEADAEMVAVELTSALKGHHHALVDISHRNVALGIIGPAAANVLNAGCALDLDTRRFPAGTATRTLLGKAEIVLLRKADGFRVECWRSFATYVSAFLSEAAREFERA
jgi:sarcosine oxidase, subunit gamma